MMGDIMLYYLNLFYIYAFLGFLLEFFLKNFIFHSMNSGIMYGPYLPVYGFGALFVIFVEKLIFRSREIPRLFRLFFTFLLLAIFLSVLEYLGGILREALFHKTFWDYSGMKFNIGKYASLEMALVWGVGSLFIIYIIQPFVEKFIKKIPILVTVFVSLVFVVDFILTFLFR